jgi:HK97 family phage major capsid protein/HK97 family phage prohead protease
MASLDTPLKRALRGDRSVMRANGAPLVVTRPIPVEDIAIRSRAQGGDGRTVDAYAAVFMSPTEIKDSDGHYMEQNDPASFNRSMSERAGSIFCIYNHGRSLGGSPSDLWSVPIGVPVPGAMRADSHGLFTSTRFNKDPESERILEAIRSGSLKGMSYTGVFVRSNPQLEAYEVYGPSRSGELPLVTRNEIALIEYGPTPIPAYDTAQVTGVRSTEVKERPPKGKKRERIEIHMHVPGYPVTTSTASGTNYTITPTMTLTNAGITPDQALEIVNKRAQVPCPDCGEGSERAGLGSGYKMPGDNITSSDKLDTDTVLEDASITCPTCQGTGMVDADEAEDEAEDAADNGVDEASEGELPEEMPVDKLVDGGGSPVKGKAKGTGVKLQISSSGDRTPEEDERERKAGNKPYGNVTYADPKNGKYPIDAEHVVAAWDYINQAKNAAKYPLNGVTLGEVKAKIKAAMTKHGHQVSDNKASSSGRSPAAATSRESGKGADAGTRAPNVGSHSIRPVTTAGAKKMDPEGRMTVEERMERQSAVRSRLAEIDTEFMGAELPGEVRTEWRQLQEELVVHERAIRDAQARSDYLNSIAEEMPEGATESVQDQDGYLPPRETSYLPPRKNGQGPAPRSTTFYNPDKNIWDLTAIRQRARSFDEMPHLYREYAMRAVDSSRFHAPNKSREDCQETVARLLDVVDDAQGSIARRVLTTGSPVYDRAFGKALSALSTASLTAEEHRALALGTDNLGGYAVPFQLDPTVILANNGAINPLREMARVEQITGKEWDGVTTAGVTVTRVSEGTEAGTGDPTFSQPTVRTSRVQGFVPFNIELDVSWGALRSQMTNLLTDAKAVEEASSFVTGSGTAPAAGGVVNTLFGEAQKYTPIPVVIVQTAGTATLAVGDLYALENSMAPRFRNQSSYLASKTTFNRMRQLFQALASQAGDSWVRATVGTPNLFNGYPAYESSAMVGTVTSGSNVMLQGDFSQFLIVDRVGMGIELIPHLFGTTRQFPVGQRGIFAIWFNNSRILVPNAFRLLQTL